MLNTRQESFIKNRRAVKARIWRPKEKQRSSLCLSILYGAMDEYNALIRPVEKNEILNEIFGGFCVGK